MTRTNRCALCCLAQEKIHPTQLRFKFLITTSSNSILSYSILFYFIVLCSTPVLCPALLCFCLVPCSAWLCPARLYSTCSHSYSYSSSSSSILFLFYSYFHACFYFHSYFYSYFFPTSPRLLLLFLFLLYSACHSIAAKLPLIIVRRALCTQSGFISCVKSTQCCHMGLSRLLVLCQNMCVIFWKIAICGVLGIFKQQQFANAMRIVPPNQNQQKIEHNRLIQTNRKNLPEKHEIRVTQPVQHKFRLPKKIGKGPGYYTHRHMRSPPMQCVRTETRRKTHTAFAVTIAWASNLRPSKLDSPQRWWECVCGWFSWKNWPKSSQQT